MEPLESNTEWRKICQTLAGGRADVCLRMKINENNLHFLIDKNIPLCYIQFVNKNQSQIR